MLKKRNAQGLSINVIIILVIGLVVLAVSIYIFTTQSGKAATSLDSCYTRGGDCKTNEVKCTGSEIRIYNVECPNENPICCINIKR